MEKNINWSQWVWKNSYTKNLMTLETIDDGFVSVSNEYLWHEKNEVKLLVLR